MEVKTVGEILRSNEIVDEMPFLLDADGPDTKTKYVHLFEKMKKNLDTFVNVSPENFNIALNLMHKEYLQARLYDVEMNDYPYSDDELIQSADKYIGALREHYISKQIKNDQEINVDEDLVRGFAAKKEPEPSQVPLDDVVENLRDAAAAYKDALGQAYNRIDWTQVGQDFQNYKDKYRPNIEKIQRSDEELNRILQEAEHTMKRMEAFEDVLEYAQNKELTLPKSEVEFMRRSLSEDKVTADYLVYRVDTIAERVEDMGYEWRYNPDFLTDTNDPKKSVATLRTESGVQAYIMERANKETGEIFYVANRIDHITGEHHQIATNNNFDVVKNKVDTHCVAVAINDLQHEAALATAMPVVNPRPSPQPLNVEDVIQYAQDRGLALPKNQIEYMRKGLEGGKVNAEYLMRQVDKVADKYNENKPVWYQKMSADPNKPIALYANEKGTQVVVNRKENKESGEWFLAASRIDSQGKFHNLGTANTFSDIKNRVEGYYVGIATKEVAKESRMAKEQKQEKAIAKTSEGGDIDL